MKLRVVIVDIADECHTMSIEGDPSMVCLPGGFVATDDSLMHWSAVKRVELINEEIENA